MAVVPTQTQTPPLTSVTPTISRHKENPTYTTQGVLRATSHSRLQLRNTRSNVQRSASHANSRPTLRIQRSDNLANTTNRCDDVKTGFVKKFRQILFHSLLESSQKTTRLQTTIGATLIKKTCDFFWTTLIHNKPDITLVPLALKTDTLAPPA